VETTDGRGFTRIRSLGLLDRCTFGRMSRMRNLAAGLSQRSFFRVQRAL